MTATKSTLLIAFILAVFIFPPSASAAIDAENVVTGKCTACHTPERIRSASKTKQEWTVLVDKEIGRGAQLTKSERVAVIDWLASKYGKTVVAGAGSPPAAQPQAQVAQTEATPSLPFNQQAKTGVELWQFLLSGGALVGSGAFLRRRKN